MDYRDLFRDEPSAMETMFAIFANNLLLDESGEPTNEKHAERRAAAYLYQYVTGRLPRGGKPFDGSPEVELF